MNSEIIKTQAGLGTKSIAVPDLGLNEIRNFRIPLPPLELQQKWADIYRHIFSLLQRQLESTQEIDKLLHSLMQKAFKGELVIGDPAHNFSGVKSPSRQ